MNAPASHSGTSPPAFGANLLHPSRPYLLYLLCLGFFLLGLYRIDIPSSFAFDEGYYVPSAVRLGKGMDVVNREHPMLAKELMALVFIVLGYSPATWRIAPLVMGTLGLLGFSKAAARWSGSPSVGIVTWVLLASNFLLFGISRLAMLDAFMFGFTGLAMAGFAAYARDRRTLFLALGGICMGLAVASKWSAAPVLAIVCCVYAFDVRFAPKALLRGILWLGVVPIATYFATYVPGMVMASPLVPADWYALHRLMMTFHNGTFPSHVYASTWVDWLLNTRPHWSYQGPSEGAERLLLLGYNPLQAWLLFPAALAGILACFRRDWVLGVPAIFYFAQLVIWVASDRSVLYFHYYLLPASFATICLAILVQRCRIRTVYKAAALAAVSVVPWLWFWPVLTAAPLSSQSEWAKYTWLPGWTITRDFKVKGGAGIDPHHKEVYECLDTPRPCLARGVLDAAPE